MTTEELVEISELRALCKTGHAKSIRQQAHLSLVEVAAVLGVDQSAISRWENGNRLPRSEVALRYSALLRHLLVGVG